MLKTFALFDFDGTLLRGDSIILFMRYALRKKLCSVWNLLRFAVAGGLFTTRMISPKRAKEIGLRFLSGKERAGVYRRRGGFLPDRAPAAAVSAGGGGHPAASGSGAYGAAGLGVADVLSGAAQGPARVAPK